MSLPVPSNHGDIAPAQHANGGLPAVEQVERRVLAVQQALLAGKSPREMIVAVQDHWGLSRRSAQLYVQRAQRAIAEDAETEDKLTYLRTSREQRDLFLTAMLECVRDVSKLDAKAARSLAEIVTAAAKLLDSRDRIAERESFLASGRPAAQKAKEIRLLQEQGFRQRPDGTWGLDADDDEDEDDEEE